MPTASVNVGWPFNALHSTVPVVKRNGVAKFCCLIGSRCRKRTRKTGRVETALTWMTDLE